MPAKGIRCLVESDIIATRKARSVEQLVPQPGGTPTDKRRSEPWAFARAFASRAIHSLQRRAVGRTFSASELRATVRARIWDASKRIRWVTYDIRHFRAQAKLVVDISELPRGGGSVMVRWAARGRNVETCEIYIDDGRRSNYRLCAGKSGWTRLDIEKPTRLALKCLDRNNNEIFPPPPPIMVRVAGTPEHLRRSLGQRQIIRPKIWFSWFELMVRSRLNYIRVLRSISPSIVCLSEDIPGNLTAPLIQAAKIVRTPSVIVPFTIPNKLEALEYYRNDPSLEVQLPYDNDMIAAFPHWLATYKGKQFMRCPRDLIVASELAGIGPPQPFVSNSGYVDRILVESEHMRRVYRDSGFPPDQLTVTGSAADDLLNLGFEDRLNRRQALYQRLGVTEDRPMLLSSIVPDQLARGVPFCEFSKYSDLLEFWVRTIASSNTKFNVVLKINPRDDYREFIHLEKFGVVVAPDDTVDLVPLADIYVTSISSTIRWAIACGIPCVNYDVYHFRYGDYLDARGVVHAETKSEFSDVIARLVNDNDYRSSLARAQSACSAEWGRLDGCSTDRIVGVFDELRSNISSTQRRRRPTFSQS